MSDTDFADVAEWLQGDEQGTSDEPEATPEAEAEAKPDQPRDEKGRFASKEEAEKAWEHANAALGRQGQEYGELKKQVSELQAMLQAQPQPQPHS